MGRRRSNGEGNVRRTSDQFGSEIEAAERIRGSVPPAASVLPSYRQSLNPTSTTGATMGDRRRSLFRGSGDRARLVTTMIGKEGSSVRQQTKSLPCSPSLEVSSPSCEVKKQRNREALKRSFRMAGGKKREAGKEMTERSRASSRRVSLHKSLSLSLFQQSCGWRIALLFVFIAALVLGMILLLPLHVTPPVMPVMPVNCRFGSTEADLPLH